MVRGIGGRRKRYVEVVADHREDGTVVPLAVVWGDGRRFEVDRVLDRRRAASLKVGGTGMRYLVRIGAAETFLYYEGPRWFVEEIVPEGEGGEEGEDGSEEGDAATEPGNSPKSASPPYG